MKKLLTVLATIGIMGTSLSANDINKDLLKIDNEILHCSLIPEKIWERDKWLANLNDNVIITCDNYLYSVRNKSWYIKDETYYKIIKDEIKKFNEISKIYQNMGK